MKWRLTTRADHEQPHSVLWNAKVGAVDDMRRERVVQAPHCISPGPVQNPDHKLGDVFDHGKLRSVGFGVRYRRQAVDRELSCFGLPDSLPRALVPWQQGETSLTSCFGTCDQSAWCRSWQTCFVSGCLHYATRQQTANGCQPKARPGPRPCRQWSIRQKTMAGLMK